MSFATDGTVGVDEARRTTDAEFALMTTVMGSDGYGYVYVQADGAIAASQSDVTVTVATGQASDGLGTYVNTTAFADNEYGWVRTPNVVGA